MTLLFWRVWRLNSRAYRYHAKHTYRHNLHAFQHTFHRIFPSLSLSVLQYQCHDGLLDATWDGDISWSGACRNCWYTSRYCYWVRCQMLLYEGPVEHSRMSGWKKTWRHWKTCQVSVSGIARNGMRLWDGEVQQGSAWCMTLEECLQCLYHFRGRGSGMFALRTHSFLPDACVFILWRRQYAQEFQRMSRRLPGFSNGLRRPKSALIQPVNYGLLASNWHNRKHPKKEVPVAGASGSGASFLRINFVEWTFQKR